MKNVLIIGENSYIGSSFAKYVDSHKPFTVNTVSAIDEAWRAYDFSTVDTILHCAGIAHMAQKKHMRKLYYDINCDLAVSVATHAKKAGVKQFAFLSTMAVYGKIHDKITLETPLNAKDFYGGSKRAAEEALLKLSSEDFKICIIRPPMVYGYGCKGNFPKLVKLGRSLPIFPNIKNERSMIYIDNLCEFLCQAIDKNKKGIHLPQNTEYVNTTKLVKTIAKLQGKKIRTTKIFNPLIGLLKHWIPQFDKLFSNLCYIKSGNEADYNVVGFEDSIKSSVQD